MEENNNDSTHEEEEEEANEELQQQQQDDDADDYEEEVEDEEETTKLEEEVKEMAKKVEDYRSTLPDHLKSSLSSILHSQRPSFSLLDDVSEPGPSSGLHAGAGSIIDNSSTELEADGSKKNSDEVQLLRDKISSNIFAIPRVLKRMNECISRIDKLVSSNETIHPVFKRKKS